jgi:hypothetical protein
MTTFGKITIGLVAAWFVFALSAAALHVFVDASQQIALSVALAAGIPLIAFFAWLAASQSFRKFALSLNPRVLTSWQTVRLLGVIFVMLEAMQLLPARFALSAGYGDIFIGATAWFAATRLAKPANRTLFILWQALGIIDLVSAVALGVTAQFVHSPGPSMYLMTVLPLSLIPTFLVPLFMMFHVISIAQASKWRAPSPALQEAQRAGRIGGAAA